MGCIGTYPNESQDSQGQMGCTYAYAHGEAHVTASELIGKEGEGGEGGKYGQLASPLGELANPTVWREDGQTEVGEQHS